MLKKRDNESDKSMYTAAFDKALTSGDLSQINRVLEGYTSVSLVVELTEIGPKAVFALSNHSQAGFVYSSALLTKVIEHLVQCIGLWQARELGILA